MKIGIFGAGNIGGNLTRRLTGLGHDVSVANSRDPETLADLVKETGATAVFASEVAKGAELVILAIPEWAVPSLAPGILDGVVPGAPLIDIGNYYPNQKEAPGQRKGDGYIAGIESGATESRWVSDELGYPLVVKAFNGMAAQHLIDRGKPKGAPGRIALPVAGDDPKAKATVMALIDELGFEPVDAGSLDESWRQQPMTPVYGADLESVEAVTKALAEASPDRIDEFIFKA